MTQRQNSVKGIRNQQAWLLRCLANLDPEKGDIVPHLIEALITVGQQLEQTVVVCNTDHAERRNSVEAAEGAMITLSQHLGDARHHMRRRAKREGFPPGLIEKLGLKRKQPTGATSREWLLLARDMIEGDAEAVAAGFEAMAQPSAQELQGHLARAEAALKRADDADASYGRTQAELRNISKELGELILDTAACLRFTQRRLPASQRRRVMRRYGFSFKGDPPPEEPKQTEQPNGEPGEPPKTEEPSKTPTNPHTEEPTTTPPTQTSPRESPTNNPQPADPARQKTLTPQTLRAVSEAEMKSTTTPQGQVLAHYYQSSISRLPRGERE